MDVMPDSDLLTPRGLSAFLGLREVSRIVDVGCGNGVFTAHLLSRSSPESLAIGVDLDRGGLVEARTRKDVESVLGDARRIPIRSDFADLVICRRLLLNLSAPIEVLREMVRVAKPGRLVAGIEPDFLSERGFSTLPGELDFLQKLLQLTSAGSDLAFGPKTVALFRRARLEDIGAMVHSPVTLSMDSALPTVHKERSARRLVKLTERWRSELVSRLGVKGYESLKQEAGELDLGRRRQIEAGEYSSVSSFPLWVVKGRKRVKDPQAAPQGA